MCFVLVLIITQIISAEFFVLVVGHWPCERNVSGHFFINGYWNERCMHKGEEEMEIEKENRGRWNDKYIFSNTTGENIFRKLSSIMHNNSKSVKSIFAQQIEIKQTLYSWNCPNFRIKAFSMKYEQFYLHLIVLTATNSITVFSILFSLMKACWYFINYLYIQLLLFRLRYLDRYDLGPS